MSEIPFPPFELRRIVGPTEEEFFDNPTGDFIWGELSFTGKEPTEVYDSVFDFGCGCGRNCRQLLLQHHPPQKYVGIDVSGQLIQWCKKNLEPINSNFRFHHHPVYCPFPEYGALDNPKVRTAPFPVESDSFSLFNAHSVFTHLFLDQTEYYLNEAKRILKKDGIIRSTWFLFDKRVFPVLGPDQNCLYIDEVNPTQAVYYDINYVFDLLSKLGFSLLHAEWTKQYGFQTLFYFGRSEVYTGLSEIEIPETIVGSKANPDLVMP